MARELKSASAPPADWSYLGSNKLPVKHRFRKFPKLANMLMQMPTMPSARHMWGRNDSVKAGFRE